MYDFEKWDPRKNVLAPAITFFPSGLVNFSKEVALTLGIWEMRSAIMYYDNKKQLVGIRVFRDLRGHVRLHRHRKSISIKSKKFIRYWQIACPPGVRRHRTWFDPSQNMILIDLSQTVRTGRRHGS